MAQGVSCHVQCLVLKPLMTAAVLLRYKVAEQCLYLSTGEASWKIYLVLFTGKPDSFPLSNCRWEINLVVELFLPCTHVDTIA